MKEYFKLKIKDIVYETEDAISIYFKQPFFGKIKYKCGQFLTVVFTIDGREFRRAYSINSAHGVDDDISITIKKVNGGVISNFIFTHLKKGDTVTITPPMGNFTLETEKKSSRNIVLFGAGSGITPLMSILKSTLYFEPESIVTLIYSNKTESSIIFKYQLDIFKERFANRIFIKHLISENDERLDKDQLGDYLQINPFYKPENALFYICGPEVYMNSIKEGLEALNIDESKILNESFTAKKLEADGSYDVVFKTKGKEELVNVPAGKSLLDVGLDAGYRMRFSCFNGQCGTCKSRCVTGSVKMAVDNILTPEEKNLGYVLPCVGFPASEGVVLELD